MLLLLLLVYIPEQKVELEVGECRGAWYIIYRFAWGNVLAVT